MQLIWTLSVNLWTLLSFNCPLTPVRGHWHWRWKALLCLLYNTTKHVMTRSALTGLVTLWSQTIQETLNSCWEPYVSDLSGLNNVFLIMSRTHVVLFCLNFCLVCLLQWALRWMKVRMLTDFCIHFTFNMFLFWTLW